jgi:3-hydroxybutyrate dehydrogenase
MFADKTAIVTGSTSGIGLGIATALAAQKCNVMLNGFGEPAAIEAIRKDLSDQHGIKTAYSAADMSKPADIRALVASAERELGPVDILVNNAGIQHVAPIEEFPADKWDAILAINLSAAFHAIKAAVPGMKRRKWGRIINIASAHGLVASGEKAGYVTAKHGLVGLTKVVAVETANSGVPAMRLPRLGAHRAGGQADRGQGQGGRHIVRAGERKSPARETADAEVHLARADRSAGRFPVR